MMFDEEELRVLVFGAEVIRRRGDQGLADAAERVLAKVDAVLPTRLRSKLALAESDA